jgi:hypothetical protein
VQQIFPVSCCLFNTCCYNKHLHRTCRLLTFTKPAAAAAKPATAAKPAITITITKPAISITKPAAAKPAAAAGGQAAAAPSRTAAAGAQPAAQAGTGARAGIGQFDFLAPDTPPANAFAYQNPQG